MRLTAVLALAAVLPACTGRVPPPMPPAPEPPRIELPPGPPPTGHGRVVLDVADGPSEIRLVEGRSYAVSGSVSASGVHTRLLCTTPCAVDLPYGSHELAMRNEKDDALGGLEEVEVQSDTTYLRTALGRRSGGGAMSKVGGFLILVAGPLAAAGGLLWALDDEEDAAGWRNATLGSLVFTALGTLMWYADRPTFQDSASTQWR